MSSAAVSTRKTVEVPQQPSMQQQSIAPRELRPSGTNAILAMIAGAATLFFAISTARHLIFRSGGLDLGFFDQAIYLISRGYPPISSFFNFHVISDHAAVILYPLAGLYLVWADPLMLLLVQAIVLASGAWPIWKLARSAGLGIPQAQAVAAAYLMYPLVLTTNVFDWHPEIFAIPGLLWAVLGARENRKLLFIAGVLLTLSCKEVLSLTVIAMGVWLLIFERRVFFGIFAMVAGSAWFIIATQLIIPYFAAGKEPSGLVFYDYLGSSLREIIVNLLLHPQIVIGRLMTLDVLKYALVLAIPVLWGLHWRTMAPLMAAAPAVLLNFLADNPQSRSPFFQYSIPIIPFLFMSVILALAAKRTWLVSPRAIVMWSLALLVVGGAARGKKLFAGESADWDSLAATRDAIAQVRDEGAVLTTHEIAPHLTHRPWLQTICSYIPLRELDEFDYVLLHSEHSSIRSHSARFADVLNQVMHSSAFEEVYHNGKVRLFKRKPHDAQLAADAKKG